MPVQIAHRLRVTRHLDVVAALLAAFMLLGQQAHAQSRTTNLAGEPIEVGRTPGSVPPSGVSAGAFGQPAYSPRTGVIDPGIVVPGTGRTVAGDSVFAASASSLRPVGVGTPSALGGGILGLDVNPALIGRQVGVIERGTAIARLGGANPGATYYRYIVRTPSARLSVPTGRGDFSVGDCVRFQIGEQLADLTLTLPGECQGIQADIPPAPPPPPTFGETRRPAIQPSQPILLREDSRPIFVDQRDRGPAPAPTAFSPTAARVVQQPSGVIVASPNRVPAAQGQVLPAVRAIPGDCQRSIAQALSLPQDTFERTEALEAASLECARSPGDRGLY